MVLLFRCASSGPPTDINQPDPGASGIKKSQPSSRDSIQHAVGSEFFSSCNEVTVAICDPKPHSMTDSGRGREEMIVQSAASAEFASAWNTFGATISSINCSEAITAEWGTATGSVCEPHFTIRF